MTPIFSRSWLMKITEVRERLIAPASLRSAWLISRACRPGSESPMSPSISAFGTRAATESITTTSTAPDRTRISVISSPCSPVSGWETSRLSMSTPSFFAYSTSSACSASMYAAAPPWRWAFATTCSASVVLPLDSGPKISVTRPRGMPPIPIAASRLIAPVGMTSTRTRGESAAMSVLDMGWEPRLVRPEYTPKPRLSPPGAERVSQVLQLAVHDRDTVEPIDIRRLPEAVHPHASGLHQLAPLRPRHRLERAPERLTLLGLHFHERHQV